ncbi:MAG: hypothetical protein R3359_12480 [Marinirhabdus sp.]|nr:hypothetical protein [Marinirhabdus sp.]
MKTPKLLLALLSILALCETAAAQTLEVGPSLGYHWTAFQRPDSGTIIINSNGAGNGKITTETDGNLAIGGYVAYYTESLLGFMGEAFYVTTSTPNYDADGIQSINVIASLTGELFNSGLYVNIGPGAGFLLNEPDFSNEDEVLGTDYKTIDFLIKGAFQYRFEEVLTLEGGVMSGFTKILDDEINRFHIFFGVKVPLNLILNK